MLLFNLIDTLNITTVCNIFNIEYACRCYKNRENESSHAINIITIFAEHKGNLWLNAMPCVIRKEGRKETFYFIFSWSLYIVSLFQKNIRTVAYLFLKKCLTVFLFASAKQQYVAIFVKPHASMKRYFHLYFSRWHTTYTHACKLIG